MIRNSSSNADSFSGGKAGIVAAANEASFNSPARTTGMPSGDVHNTVSKQAREGFSNAFDNALGSGTQSTPLSRTTGVNFMPQTKVQAAAQHGQNSGANASSSNVNQGSLAQAKRDDAACKAHFEDTGNKIRTAMENQPGVDKAQVGASFPAPVVRSDAEGAMSMIGGQATSVATFLNEAYGSVKNGSRQKLDPAEECRIAEQAAKCLAQEGVISQNYADNTPPEQICDDFKAIVCTTYDRQPEGQAFADTIANLENNQEQHNKHESQDEAVNHLAETEGLDTADIDSGAVDTQEAEEALAVMKQNPICANEADYFSNALSAKTVEKPAELNFGLTDEGAACIKDGAQKIAVAQNDMPVPKSFRLADPSNDPAPLGMSA